MKKLFLLGVSLLFAFSVRAYDFSYNGIYYNIIGQNQVEV